MNKNNLHKLLLLQGGYFFIPGLWPLIHMPSFLAVSGPKVDIWLVETVGLLLVAIGSCLLLAGFRREYVPALGLLGFLSAGAMLWIDVCYTTRDRIWDIYLVDAVWEGVLLLCWSYYFLFSKNGEVIKG